MKSPETNGWQRDENNKGWLISVAIAALIILILFRFIRLTPALLLLTFVILSLIIYQLFALKPRTLTKFFSTSFAKADQVIQRVLAEKGLPYEVANGRYYLTGSHLRLEAENYEHKGLQGVLVSFVPYEGTNMPMIMSLSQRLDEAFAEKGG